MPGAPRSAVVREGEIATYHTWSRCVQQLYLCGRDPVTGVDYEHRRAWLESLLEYYAGVFSIDIGNYQVMSNHLHLVSRTRPDIANTWSDDEVAWRWKRAWPTYVRDKWICSPTDQEIEALLANPEHVAKVRGWLSSISWLMGRWKESFSCMANAESNKHGTCWESRYGVRELCGDGANVLNNVYVDLNQLVAGMAKSLEQSNHSAIQLRIRAWRRAEAEASVKKFRRQRRRDDVHLEVEDVERLLEGAWLAPISDTGPLKLVSDAHGQLIAAPPRPTLILPAHLVGGSHGGQGMPADDRSAQQAQEPTVLEMAAENGERAVESDGSSGHAEAMDGDATQGEDEPHEPTAAREEGEPEGLDSASPAGSATRRFCEEDVEIYEPRRYRGRTKPPRTYQQHRRMMVERWRPRVSDNPILCMPFERYLAIVEWTAVELFTKRGQPMPEALADELRQLGLVPEQWLKSVERFGETYHLAVGPARALQERSQRRGKRTMHGIRAARAAFT